MKLYAINRSDKANPTVLRLFREACKKKGVEFVLIKSVDYDFSNPVQIEPGSALYNICIDERSEMVFRTLIRDDIATVFKNTFAAINYQDNVKMGSLLHEKAGVPIIKTIFDLPSDKYLLKKYAQYLGGFPVIIKARGESHGSGVMKIDSFESLISVAAYLNRSRDKDFILRQYIEYVDMARLIILDGRCLGSLNYYRLDDDFRTNASKDVNDIIAEVKSFPPEIEKAAIDAVDSRQADFGGVDILIDSNGNPHLAEVNIPCYFPRVQQMAVIDISGELVDYLIKKAANL